MSFARGERVYFDLDKDFSEQLGAQNDDSQNSAPPMVPSTAFVGDILERDSSAPPPAPSFKGSATGFPAPKKRTSRVSAFKQQRAAKAESPTSFLPKRQEAPQPSPQSNQGAALPEDDRIRIDAENRQRLAEMTPAEIERERQELFDGLTPRLIQKLLNRSNINSGSNEQDWDKGIPPAPPADEERAEKKPSTKKVTFQQPTNPQPLTTEDRDPTLSKSENQTLPQSATGTIPDTHFIDSSSSIHFPHPPQPPELDPNSPSFLNDLHDKYFPELPYDPSRVSWMAPIDPSDTSSPYHPAQQAMSAAELRFDFRGALLAPSHAREIPVTKGLHHHGDAPEAAGYTIPELARLARSKVASQRCMAYQTLGRILYRLGKGEFGVEEGRQRVDGPADIVKDPNVVEDGDDEDGVIDQESVGSAMCTGLWECVEEGHVIETLTEEANKERGHLSAKTYAQEALWNWRRGGGRRRKAV
ncbi:hypothetical protein GQ43DRAFT_254661 [Delitschia confertaspora ATCC 74209]|uniref:Transcription factor Rba50 n=1 Tax=Delitschia confertaspora ATCC 74209 TaxID=1513339 RepID=A0A9P4JFV4_9PLEO|nr:hypothetical protein GQ43DRAFT_254661 [Delitschia confertaspora ATCC 74209]